MVFTYLLLVMVYIFHVIIGWLSPLIKYLFLLNFEWCVHFLLLLLIFFSLKVNTLFFFCLSIFKFYLLKIFVILNEITKAKLICLPKNDDHLYFLQNSAVMCTLINTFIG